MYQTEFFCVRPNDFGFKSHNHNLNLMYQTALSDRNDNFRSYGAKYKHLKLKGPKVNFSLKKKLVQSIPYCHNKIRYSKYIVKGSSIVSKSIKFQVGMTR